MKVYQITTDLNQVQNLVTVDRTLFTPDFLTFNCKEREENWTPLLTYVSNPLQSPKNFYRFGQGSLVFDEQVLKACESFFINCGEILPVKVERQPDVYLLNVLNCYNVLDQDNTVFYEYAGGIKGHILKYSFHKDRLLGEFPIFKLPLYPYVDIFTYGGSGMMDDFVEIYKENNFTGLIFKELQAWE